MTSHGEALRRLCKDDTLVEQLKSDYRQARLAAQDWALLDYMAKLTLTPSQMTEADLETLRHAGFSDRDILDAVSVAAFFAYTDRLADAFGLRAHDFYQAPQVKAPQAAS